MQIIENPEHLERIKNGATEFVKIQLSSISNPYFRTYEQFVMLEFLKQSMLSWSRSCKKESDKLKQLKEHSLIEQSSDYLSFYAEIFLILYRILQSIDEPALSSDKPSLVILPSSYSKTTNRKLAEEYVARGIVNSIDDIYIQPTQIQIQNKLENLTEPNTGLAPGFGWTKVKISDKFRPK